MRYNLRMDLYVHQHPTWPHFRWNAETVANQLASVRHHQGLFLGRIGGLGFELRTDTVLEALTDDVEKSSEIEGEHLNRQQIRSSIARRLGMEIGNLVPADRHVEGVVDVILDATQRYDAPLTQERLFGWHAALFPTGYSGMWPIRVGAWRDDGKGAMQVVSGPIGKERVHYEAPAALRLEAEMTAFLEWFNVESALDPVLKAALAHLWFVMIHPFDDGNGRIGRATADVALARSERSPQRFYSMSGQIMKECDAYYEVLGQVGVGDLDVTRWMTWFLGCLDRAIAGAEGVIGKVLTETRFWDSISDVPINERQRLMLVKLHGNFEGKLTAKKWAVICKCSPDTALRDITDLIYKGILSLDQAGGRNTTYSLPPRSGMVER